MTLHQRVRSGLLPVLVLLLLMAFGGLSMANEITLMAVSYSNEMIEYLESEVFPKFEAEHGVKVDLQLTTWGERKDKLLIGIASGTPPDVIVTGYYSPYEEGGDGLLEPLDKYLVDWKYTDQFPEPLWRTAQWRGHTYIVPQNLDVRVIRYHKEMFAQSGLDAEQPPQSWDEWIEYVKILTRMNPNGTLDATGLYLNDRDAQEYFWFLRQTGLSEVNDDFTHNFNNPAALDALQAMIDLKDAAHFRESLAGGGFPGGRIAMSRATPSGNRTLLRDNPHLADVIGLFAPRRDLNYQPVAHAFVNGLGIVAASQKKDLAWKLIEALNDEDVVFDLYQISGFYSGRLDLTHRIIPIDSHFAPWLELLNYMQASVIPPPRGDVTGPLGELLGQVFFKEIPPENLLIETSNLWTRLLNDWKERVN